LLAFLLLLGCAGLVHLPALLGIVARNADFNIHYQWAVQFAEGLRGGDPYPHWMWRGNEGLGEVALLYYSPLFYYFTGVIRFVTGNTWAAMNVTFILFTAASGFYAWRLFRLFMDDRFAMIGALLLEAVPMVFMLYYYFNGFPWACACAIVTMLAYYVCRPGALKHTFDVPISVTIALLVATHIVTGLMALICFSFCRVSDIRRVDGRWRIRPEFLSWALSVALGLVLSMFYLLPALTSLRFINPEVWSAGYTPWNAFAFPTITARLFGVRWFAMQWPVPLSALLCLAFATYYAIRRGDFSDPFGRTLLALLIAGWASVFLASELSYPLWLLDTPLRKVEFPHRFVVITSICGLLANVLCLKELMSAHAQRMTAALAAVPLALSALLTVGLSAKILFIDGRPVHLVQDETRLYGGLTEYQLRTDGPHRVEYVTRGGFKAECERVQAACRTLYTTSNRQGWHIDATAAHEIRLPVFAFPAWAANIDGLPAAIKTDPATGLATVALPSGGHDVTIVWQRLASEKIGLWLTLGAALLLGLMFWRQQPPEGMQKA
jgi:hypothetical protein